MKRQRINLERTSSALPSRLDFDRLTQAADAGDEAALAELKRLLDEQPEIWRSVGDLARHAGEALIGRIANGSQLVAESLRRRVRELKDELTGDGPSQLLTLAADRVVACWLESQYAQTRCPLAEPRAAGSKAVLAYRRAADKRYETALRSLLLVRQAEAADKTSRRPRGRPQNRLQLFGA